ELIRMIQSLCTIQSLNTTPAPSLFSQIAEGQNELNIRISTSRPTAAGYKGESSVYPGSPERCLLRMRHRSNHGLAYGFTLEKDAGERLLRNHFPDFFSVHFMYSPTH